MQTHTYVENLITAIEADLTAAISPDDIARRHFLSKRQLYREFYTYTGHSVGEYIRRRRISNACERLKSSDTPLSFIADECGCETQQAFNKLFKSVVGMTPLEYRAADCCFYFYPFPLDKISLAVHVGTETIPECETRRYYDSCLLGIEDRALATLGEATGRVFGRNGKQIGNRLCYELMLATNSGGNSAGKTATYATCTVHYHEEAINTGWNYLYNIWLPASMFEQSDDSYFEEYILRNGKPYKLKLYLPVKKRKATHHIRMTSEPARYFVTATATGQNAERKASETVMSYLREHYSLLVRNARKFYVSVYGHTYTCGVECGEGFTLPTDRGATFACGLQIIYCPAGEYAVLPDDCLGDIQVGADKLSRWLEANSIPHESEPVFAVYETTDGSFDTEKIRLTLYQKVKLGKNG